MDKTVTPGDLQKAFLRAVICIETGSLQGLKGAIQAAPELVHYANSMGWTLLHEAASEEQLDAVAFLLDQGATATGPESSVAVFRTPLSHAVTNKDVPMMRLLIERLGPKQEDSRGSFPLIMSAACIKEDVAPLQVLIEYGFDVNVSTGSGTALSNACKRGHLEHAKILLEAGADPTMKALIDGLGSQEMTPSEIASASGHSELAIIMKTYEAAWAVKKVLQAAEQPSLLRSL